MTKPRSFTCDCCGNTYTSGWSEAEAEAEAQREWGGVEPDERRVICDTCHDAFMRWWHSLKPSDRIELERQREARHG